MNIGEKIRELRKGKGLTQEQLAEYLNVSSQAVSKWETGMCSPDIDMLPCLAVFFGVSTDELLGFDLHKINNEVEALITESVPLRSEPEKAEAFYRQALKKHPNNDVLLNCLLMVIPNDRAQEKLEIGEHLLDCTRSDEIRIDVLRLLTETCHAIGENAMAENYLDKIPELYFLKTEVAAAARHGAARLQEIRKTENVCFRTIAHMLALRAMDAKDDSERERLRSLCHDLLELYGKIDADHLDHAEMLKDAGEDVSALSV